MTRRMKKTATSGGVLAAVLETKEFAQKLPGRVNRVLDALAASELKMKVDIDDGAIIDGLQKVAYRITLGLILAATIVSAAMVLRVDSTFRILGYPGLAMILFALAAVGTTYLAIQIYSSRSHGPTPVSRRLPSPQPAAAPRERSALSPPQLSAAAGCAANEAKRDGDAVDRVRRLIWSWWPWALLTVYLIDKRQWWGAFGVALWAGVCSLSTPAEFPPQAGSTTISKSVALISWTRWPVRPASRSSPATPSPCSTTAMRSIRPCSRKLSRPSDRSRSRPTSTGPGRSIAVRARVGGRGAARCAREDPARFRRLIERRPRHPQVSGGAAVTRLV
jgi:hypothetical protein